jgi:hypothetical protein
MYPVCIGLPRSACAAQSCLPPQPAIIPHSRWLLPAPHPTPPQNYRSPPASVIFCSADFSIPAPRSLISLPLLCSCRNNTHTPHPPNPRRRRRRRCGIMPAPGYESATRIDIRVCGPRRVNNSVSHSRTHGVPWHSPAAEKSCRTPFLILQD